MQPDLIRRQEAIAKTMEQFRDQPLVFGKTDCAQIVRFHLKAMGHKKLPAANYSGAAGAAAVLRKAGVRTTEELFDTLLPRIAPAFMLAGDIGLVEAEDDAFGVGGGSLIMFLGGKWWGWHPASDKPEVLIIDATNVKAAWRA